MAGWFGFAFEAPYPKSGEAICRACGGHFNCDTFGTPIALDLEGKAWYISLCPKCEEPGHAESESQKALEDLLDEVRHQEQWARTEDRIDQQVRLSDIIEKKQRRA